jgi:hypothetical protein
MKGLDVHNIHLFSYNLSSYQAIISLKPSVFPDSPSSKIDLSEYTGKCPKAMQCPGHRLKIKSDLQLNHGQAATGNLRTGLFHGAH